jgi:2-polyprenyl-3-methyl-5-hydroxy-6-metoxy-1,4-benzoquinol methylase
MPPEETLPSAYPSDTLAAPCPFCARQDTLQCGLATAEDGSEYPVRACPECGTVFLWPPPSDEQLQSAYDTSYYGEGSSKFGGWIERFRDVFAGRRARQLASSLAPGARILDVGCGDGRLLRGFQSAGRYELHGIELPGPAAERAAKTPSIHLHLGTLAATALPTASFDLITLVHVYEHIPKPRETLDLLARLIKPGGRLFLAFPNISSWQARVFAEDWFHLDPPRHLNLVPPQAVINHLRSKGFRLVVARHLCLEQNIYGWIQSALNRADGRRNFLYERLKRNRSYLPDRGTVCVAGHAAAAGILLAPALALDLAAAAARVGATVEMTFEHMTAS